MTTAAAIQSRVLVTTASDTTGVNTDAVDVLAMMNDGYQQAVAQSECRWRTKVVTLTAGVSDYDMTVAPFSITDLERLLTIRGYSSSNTGCELEPVSASTFAQMRAGGSPAQDFPAIFCMPAPNSIRFYPIPVTGGTLDVEYFAAPLSLVTSGAVAGVSELSPSAFPLRFHDLIYNFACAKKFEQDQNYASAERHRQLFMTDLGLLTEWVNEAQGPRSPSLMPDAFAVVQRYNDQDG